MGDQKIMVLYCWWATPQVTSSTRNLLL